MLINKGTESVARHVEFVKYTGKWPNLCGGILTLKIDGKEVRFGNNYHDKTLKYEKFWRSGGECGRHSNTTGEWRIDVQELPEEFREYAAEIDEVFNANVEYGCCGGCR